MRRAARRTLLLATASLLVLAGRVAAHPLDEYVQATYITLGSSGVALDLELTPGVDVGSQVLALVDTDRDGSISATEGRVYAVRIAQEIRLAVDGKALQLSLISYLFPEPAVLVGGRASIRLHLRAPPWAKEVRGARAGLHQLTYHNAHEPVSSAYLVNAYRPDAPLSIVEQRRDPLQRGIQIRYRVAQDPLVWWIWMLPVALMALAAAAWAIRRGLRGGREAPEVI